MIISKLENLNKVIEIINENKHSSIAMAIKDSSKEVFYCNNFFLQSTGLSEEQNLIGLSDYGIELWKDNKYDYAIGEKISIDSKAYYLCTETLPLKDSRETKTILTEKITFYDTDGKNYILVRFKIIEDNDL